MWSSFGRCLTLYALICAGTVFLVALPAHPQTQSHQTGTSTAVWISPDLNLAPGTSIAAALAAPFDTPFIVTLGKSDQVTARILRNCDDYLPIESSIASAGSAIDLHSLRYAGTRCDALALLRTATPASRSSLGNFSWKHVSICDLPPQLALSLSRDQIARVKWLAARKGSIRNLDPTVKLHTRNATQTALDAKEWTATLTLYGRADFTGSGEDTLLIRRDASAKYGTYTASSLFLLTRNLGTRRLRVFEPRPQ